MLMHKVIHVATARAAMMMSTYQNHTSHNLVYTTQAHESCCVDSPDGCGSPTWGVGESSGHRGSVHFLQDVRGGHAGLSALSLLTHNLFLYQ